MQKIRRAPARMILYTAQLPSQHCGLNLAFEEAFFRAAKPARSLFLFFYENTDAVVLGKSLVEEVYAHKGPSVYRRISGGGSVLHCRGNLNYSLFLSLEDFPEFMNISLSYEKILGGLAPALGRFVTQRGYSDLAILCRGTERKFSGSAQCRKRGWIMHHGTLLYDKAPLKKIPLYLRMPPKQPAYRNGRSHRDFMACVLPCYHRSQLIWRVRQGFARAFGAELRLIPAAQLPRFTHIPPFQAERPGKKGYA
jgi:lipoate-protein ligase A